MAMKDFNWKKYMVEKGERVALGVAGLLTLILLATNVKSYFNAGPTKHAKDLDTKTKKLQGLLASNKPTKPADTPETVEDALRKFVFDYVSEPSKYQVASLFLTGETADTYRLQPELLTPVEGKAAYVQAQLKSYIFDTDPKGRLVIKVRLDAPAGMGTPMVPPMARDASRNERAAIQNQLGRGSRGSQANNALRGTSPSIPDTRQYAPVDSKIETKFVPVDTIANMQDANLMQTIRPVRMAEIVASFPLRAQVDEFSKKLRISRRAVLEEASNDEVEVPPEGEAAPAQRQQLEAFRFLGVVVERRQVDRQGKPLFPDAGPHKNGYEEIDAVAALKPLLVLSGLQTEEENPKLEPVLQDGLVMPRLFSARKDQYPEIETELPTIDKAIKDLEKAATAGQHVAPVNQFNSDHFDPYVRRSPSTGTGTPAPTPRVPAPGGRIPGGRTLGGMPPPPRGGMPTTAPQDDKLTLAEHCLIRVLDVTVKPGESYQYRIRVKMANPNFGRTDVVNPQDADDTKKENKELKPNPDPKKVWFEIPGFVTVPAEMHYYAVDQKALEGETKYSGGYKDAKVGRDQTVLQIHKYLENASPDRTKNVPVGEWSVAERVIVGRGEVIDRPVRVEVPILVEEEGKWKLASTQGSGTTRDPGIDVWFDGVKGRPALLVDFDGGTQIKNKRADGTETTDRPGQEVLILGPDGRLLAHYSGADAKNPEREAMLKAWRERIEALKKEQTGDPMSQPMSPRNPFDRGGPRPGRGP